MNNKSSLTVMRTVNDTYFCKISLSFTNIDIVRNNSCSLCCHARAVGTRFDSAWINEWFRVLPITELEGTEFY